MGKKAKKIAIHLAEATAIELLKQFFRRVSRRKTAVEEHTEIPCNVVDRVSFLIEEMKELSQEGYTKNILHIIKNVASPILHSPEVSRYLQELKEKHRWIKKEISDAESSFKNFEKYREKEWLEKASAHIVNAMIEYGKFAKPLDEILLMHSKPATLKPALQIIERNYVRSKDFFNRLVFDYHKFSVQCKDYVHYMGQNEAIEMSLPDIPSKENLLILAKVTAKETTPQ